MKNNPGNTKLTAFLLRNAADRARTRLSKMSPSERRSLNFVVVGAGSSGMSDKERRQCTSPLLTLTKKLRKLADAEQPRY